MYSADADFSCFADLAVTSPVDYYLEGQGSLMQCVLTPATQYMPIPNEEIAARVHQQVSVWFLRVYCADLAHAMLLVATVCTYVLSVGHSMGRSCEAGICCVASACDWTVRHVCWMAVHALHLVNVSSMHGDFFGVLSIRLSG